MIRRIVQYGDPVLRAKGREIKGIDAKIRALADDMLATMEAANGVGLAAQQVGEAMQLTVIDVSQSEDRPSAMWIDGKPCELSEWMPMILVNPELTLEPEREMGLEGCLSFPDITVGIERAEAVTAKAQLLDGRKVEFRATGLLARALQHEVDHLNGILFIDRMSSAAKASLSGKLKRLQRSR